MNTPAENQNPLLADATLPLFKSIAPEHVVPAIEAIIKENRAALAEQLANLREPSWTNLVEPFEEREDRLARAWSPIGHLNGVANSPELRQAYQQALALLTEYHTEISQNGELYAAYQRLASSDEYPRLNRAQQKTIDNALRDFRLAGVALEADKKTRYASLKKRLSELSTQFSNNVLDATQGWYKHTTDEEDLAGLPETARAAAEQAAQQRGLDGYVLTLDAPSYMAVMMHADSRSLREEMYRAYVTRASELGLALGDKDPAAWDNSAIIDETLASRFELAQLLGFANYAELSLATKMAKSSTDVLAFLDNLASTSLPAANKEFAELSDYVAATYQLQDLKPWDLSYYSEKRRQAVFAISDEELRPYFPAEKVCAGLFEVVQRLFGVTISADPSVTTWHKDAKYYRVQRDGETIAGFYFDLYARENKRGGAWMDDCRVRRASNRGLQLPVAYLTCNFMAPSKDRPSLLSHNEVTTLFHEFGHGLHHMLTQVDVAAVSGINGVAWDAVELPSQFLENWCWCAEVVPLISAHYETGEPLPKDLLDKLLAAKNYQSAMQMMRQLEFALFDFRLHLEYKPGKNFSIQALLDDVRNKVAVMPAVAYNRFQNSFSHIFAGGYAAGYYSYKWAEVLASDAFAVFEDEGIFNQQTARRFLTSILERGGSEDAMDLFVHFRGREPDIEPLLRHSGIVVSGERL